MRLPSWPFQACHSLLDEGIRADGPTLERRRRQRNVDLKVVLAPLCYVFAQTWRELADGGPSDGKQALLDRRRLDSPRRQDDRRRERVVRDAGDHVLGAQVLSDGTAESDNGPSGR